ncbi:Porin P precursor [Roseimaritima multifibrata]|uniref:Porin P n=1 Tax=Roseimaritima multifibrata TaxID=1930274 RepID=A0A517MNV8_9BACT|nr:porin [Roseimaritima multifibrata]QDS96566.1 Porin P precursor [Roseimaritima multifibrata]
MDRNTQRRSLSSQLYAAARTGILCLTAFHFGCVDQTANAAEPFLGMESAAEPSEPVGNEAIYRELQRLQSQIDSLQAAPADPIIYCEAPQEKPKYPTARLTGFFQADIAWFGQDENNRRTLGNGNLVNGDLQDGADFRRARLAAVGDAWDNVSYMLEMDFAFPGRPSFMDVWLDIDDVVGKNNLRIGQFRQPFGMDGQTGVKDLTFLERALPFAFSPFRQIGAMGYGNSDDQLRTWAASVYRFPTGPYGGNVGDNGGYGISARTTALLIDNGDQHGLFHLGGGYSFIDPANDAVQYRSQPEIFISESGGAVLPLVPAEVLPFVDTGPVAVDHVNLFNFELAASRGPLHAQSEIVYAAVQQRGNPSVSLPGAYVQAGYVLTGESRSYNRQNGVFGRVNPKCSVGKQGGIGAWEIATRWSYLDLTDANVLGGRLNDVTLGLNWYLNPRTKFQWNYIHAMLDNPIYGDSEADVYAMRAQVDF